MQPKVSIVMPFCGREGSFARSVDSILSQTFESFELIIVDSSADDSGYAFSSNFAMHDKRIKILEVKGKSLAACLNAGTEYSTAPLVAFMHPLDTCSPYRIEKQFNYLMAHADIGLVACQVTNSVEIHIADEQERVSQFLNWTNRIIAHDDILVNRFIETPFMWPTAMVRKELFLSMGNFIDGDFPVDFELVLRWLDSGVKMYKIPEPMYNWAYTHDRFNYTGDRFFEQGLFELKSRYLFEWLARNNPFHPEVAVWGAGKSSRQRFYILHELGISAKFFIDLRANPEHKVIQYQHIPPAGRHFILSYISNRAAREKIRAFLVELGYTEGKDFICIA
ncbi:MAG: glycosyltransferase family 2 protein [Bacteroidales bacterium]|nr:glycosyltransferase family 2 protein [Bacteroidales bacterium]